MDLFDLGLDLLPKKVARLVLLCLLLLSGGSVMTWYVQEKATSLQEVVQRVVSDMIEDLAPPPFATVEPPKAV